MRRTDHALVHRGGGLDGQQLLHQGVVNTAAKLRQRFGQGKMILRTIELNFCEATDLHDCYVGADGYIRSALFVFEQLQCQQEAH